MKADILNLKAEYSSLNTIDLTIRVRKTDISKLPKGKLEVEIRKKVSPRTLSQNALMWELCSEIGFKIGSTKDEVYRPAITECIVPYTVKVDKWDVPGVVETWESKGIGWVAIPLDSFESEVGVLLYPGSSVYSKEQMMRMITYLTDSLKEIEST